MKVELRDYQLDAVASARQAIRELRSQGKQHVRVLICAPTGAGKTVIGSHLVEASSLKGARSTFVVDRLSLINQ